MNHTPDRAAKSSVGPIPLRVAQRAATRYVERDDGCWISTYSVASHGYAQIGWQCPGRGKVVGTTAHRAAWTYYHGQIEPGSTVDHMCKERRCVRPDHLRLLSNFENARRTSGRDWPLGQCVNGHPNSELTLMDGGRRVRCRICAAEYQRRYRAKVRAREAEDRL